MFNYEIKDKRSFKERPMRCITIKAELVFCTGECQNCNPLKYALAKLKMEEKEAELFKDREQMYLNFFYSILLISNGGYHGYDHSKEYFLGKFRYMWE